MLRYIKKEEFLKTYTRRLTPLDRRRIMAANEAYILVGELHWETVMFGKEEDEILQVLLWDTPDEFQNSEPPEHVWRIFLNK